MAQQRKTTSMKTSESTGSKTWQPAPADAISLLMHDHRSVEELFQKYESVDSEEEKKQLAKKICTELIVHTKLEEEIFYPACREKAPEYEALDEAQVEHDSAKILIGELMTQDPASEFYDAKMSVLSEYIKHHVGEEEKPGDGIFAKARTVHVDMNVLGQYLHARKQELLSKAETEGFQPPQPRALELRLFEAGQSQQSQAMNRRYDPDREGDAPGASGSGEGPGSGGGGVGLGRGSSI